MQNLKELSQIFGVKLSWAYERQKKYISDQIKEVEEDIRRKVSLIFRFSDDEWLLEDYLEEAKKRKSVLDRKKIWLNKIIKEYREAEKNNVEYIPKHRDYDVEEIKKVPIDMIVKITPQNYFVHNPFRKERSPSNSLYWYKGTNTWMDFGTDSRGDNIDLVMHMEGCNFREALEYLSQYI